MDVKADSQRYRFGEFELDLKAHQLRLRGAPVKLERRPFQLLALLVARPGLLVTREELIQALWPPRIVIDFDTGLNTLVRKVRRALGDSPEAPAFIETVAGLGYRFIAPLDQDTAPAPAASREAATADVQIAPQAIDRRPLAALAAVILLIVAAVALGVWMAASRAPAHVSVAVLPFENLTQDDELNYLAAGLAEDTGASLARIDIRNLRTIGRASTQALVAAGKTPAQIGRELSVDFIVASSLRADQARIRVTSRLIRVSDNVEVWTANFDRELTSTLGIQQELSIAIAEQVRLRLSPAVRAAVSRRQTLNPEAYDLYLRGRYSWSLIAPAGIRQALDYYDRAIAEDPTYALAWAGIVQALSTAPVIAEVDPATVAARASEAVQHALEFGADLAEVQIALGYYHWWLDWDWPAAEAALRNAIAIDPDSAVAHMALGHVLSQSGNHAESRMMARRARELDPFFAMTFVLSATMAFQASDYLAAVEFARQSVVINPESWAGYLNLAQALAAIGDHPGALAAHENAERYSGSNNKSLAYRAHDLARMGRAEEARAIIAALEARSHERYVPPYTIALIYAGLGEPDAAFQWLERALEASDPHLIFTSVDPRWDALRDEPRFLSLLSRCHYFGLDPRSGRDH
jgi:TolB-like protein/DNA-binding winged helix-turn-helix (wHTH) protein/cytochrome c-type biogenesis protein CcmH/NrfG